VHVQAAEHATDDQHVIGRRVLVAEDDADPLIVTRRRAIRIGG